MPHLRVPVYSVQAAFRRSAGSTYFNEPPLFRATEAEAIAMVREGRAIDVSGKYERPKLRLTDLNRTMHRSPCAVTAREIELRALSQVGLRGLSKRAIEEIEAKVELWNVKRNSPSSA